MFVFFGTRIYYTHACGGSTPSDLARIADNQENLEVCICMVNNCLILGGACLFFRWHLVNSCFMKTHRTDLFVLDEGEKP
jgi:hypothetical protein